MLWAAIAHLLVARMRDDRPQLWLPIGALLGVALLDEHTVVLLGVALGL